ncbi:MAG: hypothetical protein IVW54_03925 [Candidatus Binataceae bacterium]|nr:hypothetical protein [Candidatus Binataceae bacterium]
MQIAPTLSGRRSALAIAMVLAVTWVSFSSRALAANWIDFPSTDFTIYTEDTKQVIGHSRYYLERVGPNEARLRGDNHYLDGEYDDEIDTLAFKPGAALPQLTHFSHVYYKSDGSILVAGTADLKTGQAVCVDNEPGGQPKTEAKLDFPPDTYAGASMLIPIEQALRAGRSDPIVMHFFDCTPKPRLLTIRADITANQRWALYRGKLIEIEAKPDLGWIDLVAAPFLPTTHAWFEPADTFSYVGGGINRYFYSKTHVLLVKKPLAPEPGKSDAAGRPQGKESPSASAAKRASDGQPNSASRPPATP